MRVLALIVGMMAATCAAAEDLYSPIRETDAMTAQFVYEARFGGATGTPIASSFKLQFANEGQRLAGVAPMQAELRNGQFYVNGLNVERMLIARQDEAGGGISALWGGWLPLVIVIGAAGLILVDGQDQDFTPDGTGGS